MQATELDKVNPAFARLTLEICALAPKGGHAAFAFDAADPGHKWRFPGMVPTIYKAYFSGLCKGIHPENPALYGFHKWRYPKIDGF
jgi:hypothetical protein